MGVMSGTLDLLQRAYAGTHIREGVLHFDPRLPPRLEGLSFSMQFHGTPILVTVEPTRLTLSAHRESASRPVMVAVGDEVRELHAGDECIFHIRGSNSADTVPGAIFDVDGVLVDSPHERHGAVAARAVESEWADIRDQTTCRRKRSPASLPQQMSGKPRMSGARAALAYFAYPMPTSGRRSTRRASRPWSSASSRPATSPPTPTPAFHHRREDAGSGGGRSSSRTRAVPPPIRLDSFAQERESLSVGAPGPLPPVLLRRRRVGRDFAHVAAPGDVSHRGPGAGVETEKALVIGTPRRG